MTKPVEIVNKPSWTSVQFRPPPPANHQGVITLFTCKECHDNMTVPCPHGNFESYKFTSYGKCESCGKARECVDCHAHHSDAWLKKLQELRTKKPEEDTKNILEETNLVEATKALVRKGYPKHTTCPFCVNQIVGEHHKDCEWVTLRKTLGSRTYGENT